MRFNVRSRATIVLSLMVHVLLLCGQAQPWSQILKPSQAIDWTDSGVGGIPARAVYCASLMPTATVEQINAALASCPHGEAVYLARGTYSIAGTINIPSNVTLRGAGANLTILNATGKGGGDVISLGSGWVHYNPVSITGGASAGSTNIAVASASGIHTGTFLVITETNNPGYVSSSGSEGTRNWCDGEWTKTGSLARGQIVEVTDVRGAAVTISPGLYGAYTNAPVAVPFSMAVDHAGVEDLQVYANNTGYAANFGMSACAYCWIKGVESNYTDGDHVEVQWGYRDEIRDSYFSNAFQHRPGAHDSDIQLALKTSASLVENNIIERTHQSILLQWGAAGNVISYNYTTGEFDSGAPNYVLGGIFFHGAHPQFNLLEGNVITKIDQDSTWGTSSQTTAYRNWVLGTNRICSPMSGRGAVNCAEPNGHYGSQAARAIQMSYLATLNNFVGNVVGSEQMQSLIGSGKPLAHVASIEYPSLRSYDAVAYGWSFGFGKESDDGTGTGCSGGTPPCHLAGTSSTDFFHGNYNNAGGAITWDSGVTHQLPASFYLTGSPAWWRDMPFPATGPDVTGGTGPRGHSYGNPAQSCYFEVMGGTDGGAGGPLTFNASTCYRAGSQPLPLPAGFKAEGSAATPPEEAPQVSSEPALKPNPLETMRNSEPKANEEYRLGKGDEITVDFSGRPDMQAKEIVGPDGRISLPLAGEVMLAGFTRSEAAGAIEAALKSYYDNLAVQVSVTKYTANRVLLLGAVDNPGFLTFDGTPTLLEAIARGGVQTGPNKASQIPDRCAIYRGHDQVLWVDLRALVESGNTLADLRLRRDDVIYVPSALERFISVLGEVQHPGAIPLTHNSTLASVLAESGGFTDKAGSKPHIQIVDPATGSSRILSFNDVLNPVKSLEVALKPGEIIFVPKSGFYRATYFLERLNPLVTVASMAFYEGALR